MLNETLLTIEKMLEPLPEYVQQQVIEHLREYLAEMQAEGRWGQLYQSHRPKLEEMARLAKQQIAQDRARPLNLDEL
jgi:hypothetical protein